MRAPLALAVLGVALLAVAGAWQPGAGSDEQPVLAFPLDGDRGHYQVTYVTVGPDGSTERSTSEHVSTWARASVDVPGGQTRELATFRYAFPPPGEDGEDAVVSSVATKPSPMGPLGELAPTTAATLDPEREVHQRTSQLSFHYTELPGGAALTALERVVDDRSDGDTHVFASLARTTGPCEGQRTAWIVGSPADEAKKRVSACLAKRLGGRPVATGIEAGWEDTDDHGWVWHVKAQARYEDHQGRTQEATLELKTSPVASMELAETLTWTQTTPKGTVEHRYQERLVGYEAGGDALARTVPDLAPPAEVPLVTWTEQGPADGGLEAFGFGEALEQARTEPRAQRYLDEHPEATLFKATFVDRSGERGSAATTAAPRGCTPDAASAPPAPTPTVPEHGWSLHWTGDGEHMIVDMERSSASDEEALATLVPTERHTRRFPAAGPFPGFELPRVGPSPQALLEHRRAAEGLGPEQAASFVRVQASWGQASDGKPLLGTVGRIACTQQASGETEIVERGLRFVDGQARASFGMVFRDEGYPGFQTVGLTQPAQGDAGEERWDPPRALGIAGLAVLGSVAISAGTRTLSSLSSRLRGRELLEHDTRRRLLEAIERRPGRRLVDVAEELDLHPATAEHHLAMLERERWIQILRRPAGTVLLPAGHSATEACGVLAHTHARRLLAELSDEPGLNVTELADAVGIAKSHASRLVADLEEAGFVDRRRDGRSVRFSLTERGRGIVG